MSEAVPARARFHHQVAVRFRDLDSMGHAHHTLPLVYLEEARARYWREVAGRGDVIDYVMATVTVRFHARIHWPASVEVALRTTHIGGKSFMMEFAITDADGTLLASGESTQVMYDYAADCSMPVPADVRAAIEAFEAGAQEIR
jgi:acyl-CoA thioester hydrolase